MPIEVLVARGAEGGGHGRPTIGTLPLLESVLDAVDSPVLAAGGIATGHGVRRSGRRCVRGMDRNHLRGMLRVVDLRPGAPGIASWLRDGHGGHERIR